MTRARNRNPLEEYVRHFAERFNTQPRATSETPVRRSHDLNGPYCDHGNYARGKSEIPSTGSWMNGYR